MAESTRTTSAATTLPKEIFKVDVVNHQLLKTAYDAYLANNRRSTATTKTRGEVRGGGKKPWRQKGTGRARFGSTRNPIWRTGGIVFGPRGIENYKITMPKQAKRIALRQALSLANKAGKITVIQNVKTTGKTRELVDFLRSNKAEEARRVLLLVDEKSPALIRATSNLQSIVLARATYATVYHILNADRIFITETGLEQMKGWLSPKASEEKRSNS